MKNQKKKPLKIIKNSDIKITPLVKSLSGVVKLPSDYDYKKDYAEYLYKKYISLK